MKNYVNIVYKYPMYFCVYRNSDINRLLNMYNFIKQICNVYANLLPHIDFPSANGVLDLVVFSFLSPVPGRFLYMSHTF